MATFWGMVMQLQEELCGGCKSLPPSLGMGESYFKSLPLFFVLHIEFPSTLQLLQALRLLLFSLGLDMRAH